MLSEKNESIAEAAETVYKLSQDEMIRLQCEAREDYLLWEWRKQYRMKELETENSKLVKQNKQLIAENERLRSGQTIYEAANKLS